jgi:CBS domain containing-hemolysin-like protein
MEGIVTIEDTIETLMGKEIVDEKDTISDMQQYALEKWKNRRKEYMNLTNVSNNN